MSLVVATIGAKFSSSVVFQWISKLGLSGWKKLIEACFFDRRHKLPLYSLVPTVTSHGLLVT